MGFRIGYFPQSFLSEAEMITGITDANPKHNKDNTSNRKEATKFFSEHLASKTEKA
jgi:hypothetical protein